MQRDEAVLLDIVHAAQLICDFSAGMDRSAFLADAKTQSAVLHQVMIMGEAVKRLSEEFRAAVPDVPWSEIARMRDRTIHQYHSVDLNLVWGVVEHHIPELVRQLEPLLPQGPDNAEF